MTRETLNELRRIEAGLRREGFRGHVYMLPSGAAIIFATTTSAAHGTVHNVGPRPLVNRIEDVRGDRDTETWLKTLRENETARLPIPQTIWNTPHLVITGATPKHALAMVFQHPHMYKTSRVRELAAEAGVETVEDLERIYRTATGAELPARSAEHFRSLAEQRDPKTGRQCQTPGSATRDDTVDAKPAPTGECDR